MRYIFLVLLMVSMYGCSTNPSSVQSEPGAISGISTLKKRKSSQAKKQPSTVTRRIPVSTKPRIFRGVNSILNMHWLVERRKTEEKRYGN